MTVYHDAVAALPIPGSADKALLRNIVTARMPYVLSDSDVVTNLVALDPSTGAAIVDILYLGRVFHYDPTDTTTANDGVSCLVSSDGRRYKLATSTDVFAYAVLDNSISVPPGSPSIGDAYLISAAATGAWAGKDGYVTVQTKRGWEFINFGIGRMIYVESVESYYHKSSLGVWTTGFGANALSANSVPITAIIGAKASFIIKVENQTTNAPPGSPTAPTAYIIGPSPTGAWAGNAGMLAICLVSGSFTIIAPVAGDQVYDKAQQITVTFNGSAWVPTAGGVLNSKIAGITPATTFTSGGAGSYTFSYSTPPTTAFIYEEDSRTLTYTAKAAGNKLIFHYSFQATCTNAAVVALFQDTISNAVAWQFISPIGGAYLGSWQFGCVAPDALSHVYKVRVVFVTTGGSFSSPGSFYFRVEEYPQ